MFDRGAGGPSAPAAAAYPRKEPIRIQMADNFKKAVAFWKQ